MVHLPTPLIPRKGKAMTSKGASGSVDLSQDGEMTIRDLHVAVGRRRLVNSYSGAFPRGALVWLKGPNGSGKSTFLAALERRLSEGAGIVGWVHPGMALPPGYQVGAWRRCLSRGGSGVPPLLADRLGAKLAYRELSTGEQRLLLMEGVLALPRDVILMDEALEHLAPERRHEVVAAVRFHGTSGVTWLASHVPPMSADHVLAASHILTLDGYGGCQLEPPNASPVAERASSGPHPTDPVSASQVRQVIGGELPTASLLIMELHSWFTARVTWGWVGCLIPLLVLGEILYQGGFLAPGEELRWGGFVLLVGLPWAYGFGVVRDGECGFLSYCLANLTSSGRYLRVRLLSALLRVTALLLLVGLLSAGMAWVRGGEGWRVGAQLGSWACLLLFLLPALFWLEVVGRARFPAVALALMYVGAGMILVALGEDLELLRLAMGVGSGLPDHPDLALVTRAVGGGLTAWLSVPILARFIRPILR